MTDYKEFLRKLNKNLNILTVREAKYAGNAPLDLLNQIEDHEQAIDLTRQAITGKIGEAEWHKALKPLLLAIENRSIHSNKVNSSVTIGDIDDGIHHSNIAGHDVNIEAETYVTGDQNVYQAPEEPPFWRGLSRANLIIAIVLGFIATVATVLAVPQFNAWILPSPSDTPIPTLTNTPISTHTPTITPTPSPSPTPLAFNPATDNETLIVVAAFHETSATKTEPHTKIRRAIEEAAEKVALTTLRVEQEPTVLNADEREAAEALGNRYNAGMIIWGEDTGVEVIVNFLNLKEPNFFAAEVKISETERTQIANPQAYNRFIVNDLPAQLTFLSLFALGQSYRDHKDIETAIEVIEEAVSSLPSEMNLTEGVDIAYFELGWLYQNAEDANLNQAELKYTKALELNPDFADAYINRGNIYYDTYNFEYAIQDYTRAIELNPNDISAYNNRAFAYYYYGYPEQSIQDFSKVIELNPDNVQQAYIYISRGDAYFDADNLERAIQDYTTVIESARDLVGEAYDRRGRAYVNYGDQEQAISDIYKAIEVNPDNIDFWNNLCWFGSLSGRAAEVIDTCEHAVEFAPDEEKGLFRDARGLARALTRNYEGAIDDFKSSVDWLIENDLYELYGGEKRETWITELEANRNPFDETTLKELLTE